MNDRENVDRARFVALISQHNGIIHKICRLYRDTIEDREDLYQEITFQLWKSYAKYRGDAQLSTWLYRIALNTAITAIRKKQPNITYSLEIPDLPDSYPDEEQLLRQEQLFKALKQLSDSDKAIITLFLEDMSYKEIGEVSGISENYVAVKINRIKSKIQTLIKS